MPGPSSSTWSSTRSPTVRTPDRDRGWSRTSARSPPGWRRSARGAARRRSPATGSPGSTARAPRRCSAAAGRNASTASLHHRVGVDRRGVQRELVRVEAGEVEEVGDQSFEPTRLRRDHVGGADARVHALDGAVGDRLRVAADRRERRAEVVRHAEQERALVPAGDVEVVGHRVDRVGEAGELVVAHVRRCRPAR